MSVYTAEFLGTLILVLMGNAVVANVLLKQTKGHAAGWIAITAGWGFAVYTAVLCVQDISGAHLNPAVTVGLAAAGKFEWALVSGYMVAQMLGAMVGAGIVYVLHQDHYAVTDDPDAKLGTFCTAPAIRNLPRNLVCEIVATFVLVFAVLSMTDPSVALSSPQSATEGADSAARVAATPIGLGSLGAVRVGLVVFAIGITLGGTTGYAINPARDLGPRITHALLPIPGKRDSDWSYSMIPIAGPLLGGLLAAAVQIFIVSPS